MAFRHTLPLFLAGTIGVGLLGFGLTGLSSAEPQLRTAHETVQLERQQAESLMQRVNCDPDERPMAPAPPEV